MNKKETLSITQKYTIQYVINGCLWLLYSISNLISLKPVKIIGAVILFISAFCSFYTLLAKQESDDEMSIQHILSAKSMSLEILLCSMMIVGILSVFISFPFFKAYGRKEHNMQQSELANLVGVRRETIGNLENGKYNPSLKLAMDIAKVFDTTVEDIFTFEDDDEKV